MMLRRFSLLALALAATGNAASAQTVTSSAGAPATDDGLNLRYADGIIAIAEDKVITVADVRQEIGPLLPQLQRDAVSEKDYNDKLQALEDNVTQNIIDKVLIIHEFRKDEKHGHIPDGYIDDAMARELTDRFDGDRSKLLAYLRTSGKTIKDYRNDVEENMIYYYMLQQHEKAGTVVSPVRIEQFYKENKDQFYQEDQVYLRMIQLTHANGETDAQLWAKADGILSRLRSGESSSDLAKQLSEDSRRSKGGDLGWRKRSDLKPEFAGSRLRAQEGRMHPADPQPRRLLPSLRAGPPVRRHPAPERRPRPDRGHPLHPDQERRPEPLARAPAPRRLREALLSRS